MNIAVSSVDANAPQRGLLSMMLMAIATGVSPELAPGAFAC